MKVIIKITVLLCLLHLVACDGMNSLHEKYLEQGEIVYTGVIDSLKTYPGNNRVKFTWEINSDPRISKTVIYWNEHQDSSVVQVKRISPGRLPMETMLDMPEGNYIFEFVTKDNEEHHSMFVEQTVQIYGEKLIETLRNRSIKSISADSDGEATITWFPIDDLTVQYTTVRYTDHSEPGNPVRKAIRIENDDTETQLSHVSPGDVIEVTSTHLPNNGLDRIDALPKEYSIF